jgi:hypothetical protein
MLAVTCLSSAGGLIVVVQSGGFELHVPTLRIPGDLIAKYRDCPWEARCRLGELAERVLDDYRQSRRR